MLFKIRHLIQYEYSHPVFIEPTVVRLTPRTDSAQRLLEFNLNIKPDPEGNTDSIDLDGSSATYLWFSGIHPSLFLEATSQIRTLRKNPFDFVLSESQGLQLPMDYPEGWKSALAPYRNAKYSSTALKAFTQEILSQSKNQTLDFLNSLTTTIHGRFEKVEREEGKPLIPDQVMKLGKGACRDLTLLYLEACREVGLAARYVSGYTRGDDRALERELHAWAEVYLPGGGWRGFDPTLGLAVADQHVALCSHWEPELTLPTGGTFRGTGAKSKIQYEVRIQVQEEGSGK